MGLYFSYTFPPSYIGYNNFLFLARRIWPSCSGIDIINASIIASGCLICPITWGKKLYEKNMKKDSRGYGEYL